MSDKTAGGAATSPMLAAVVGAWALLFGMGVVMMGNGLQGSLLGLRAGIEGFSTAITGFIMSGYFVGFALGSWLAPHLLHRVGHIRVFAALASLASMVALLHVLSISPYSWAAMRIVTGFCYAGLYIVAESWLNNMVANEKRGQLLSIYMVISLGGMSIGPLLLNLADPGGDVLFILLSVLVSFALVPILLSVGPVPRFDAPEKLGLLELYRISPLGVVGCIGAGMSNGALVSIGAVYAGLAGLSIAEVSLFVGLAIAGGMLLQAPVGYVSDQFDRRWVLTVVTLAAAGAAGASLLVPGGMIWPLLLLITLFGGLSFPIYSLSLAHANDWLKPDQMVAASSGLVLATGAGAVVGPAAAGLLMAETGPGGFFLYFVLVHVGLGVFALYRMTQRASRAIEDQSPHVLLSRTSALAAAAALETAREQMEEADDAGETTAQATQAPVEMEPDE